jgi:hypothetical protein
MNSMKNSTTVNKEKMIQYVSHCLSSPSCGLSIALKLRYPGYMTPAARHTGFMIVPPISRCVPRAW